MTRSLVIAADRKRVCDTAFHSNLIAANVGKPVCQAVATVYREAVSRLGWDPFSGMEVIGQFVVIGQDQEQYMNELRQFFNNGTSEEFAALVKKVEQGNADFSFTRAIQYVPGVGLVNK